MTFSIFLGYPKNIVKSTYLIANYGCRNQLTSGNILVKKITTHERIHVWLDYLLLELFVFV